MTENKKDRKIRGLIRTIEKLECENYELKKDVESLRLQLEELTELQHEKEIIKIYESELKTELEYIEKLRNDYQLMIKKYREFFNKQKKTCRQKTDKAIREFTAILNN